MFPTFTLRDYLAAVLFLVMPFGGSCGCSVLDTGPKVSETAASAAVGSLKALLSQYQPDAMNADARAKIDDPRYRARVFVGAGTVVDVFLSLEGGELDVDVNSAGRGLPVDRATVNEMLRIAGANLSADEKNERLISLLAKLASGSKPGNDIEIMPETEP